MSIFKSEVEIFARNSAEIFEVCKLTSSGVFVLVLSSIKKHFHNARILREYSNGDDECVK